MRVLVLGSGLLGITTAYVLASRGHSVTVVDRHADSAAETSFANGGQLSYSHAEPWSSPSSLKKLPKWLFRSDAPLVFRPRADWEMITWGLQFLRNCTTKRALQHGEAILRLGLYSKRKMEQLRHETGVGFDFLEKGIVHLCHTEHDLEVAVKQAEFQAKFGCDQKVLTRGEILAMEPSLAYTDRPIAGGIHSFMDESGDPYLFCNRLAEFCVKKLGVTMLYNTNIESIEAEPGKIVSVTTDTGVLTADAYVMALGSFSTRALKPLGISVPIYPMKGYSVTIRADEFCPNVSITDGSHKIVFSRLGDRLRVAGTAEFAGYDAGLNRKRIDPIVKAARSLFPKADWDNPINEWGCLRPTTPDGPPILGLTPYENLFLNTGHGTLGWTQAAGSAAIVADIIEKRTPEILLHGLTLERYF